MKGIEIVERLRPYSHTPGSCCLLPHSSLQLQIFPTRVCVYEISLGIPRLVGEVIAEIQGPVKEFTVCLDLEKENIWVWGWSKEGYFRYRIAALPQEKVGIFKVGIFFEKKVGEWKSNSSIISFPQTKEKSYNSLNQTIRLSLGNHKAQDIEAIRRRADMKEIFPLWHRLGLLVPSVSPHEEGTAALLKTCKEAIEQKYPEKILPEFYRLFLAGFSGILSPRLKDEEFQGLGVTNLIKESSSPLILLQEGSKLIESLFLTRAENHFGILPHLPPEFHSGRMTNLLIGSWGNLNLEWSKKLIRRVILHAEQAGEIIFIFQKTLKSFRLRKLPSEKGIQVHCGSPISLEKGYTYLFDNFQK